ncbi:MAG TPA: acylneuraminate cytidylyltransferase family protein [Anaerovoracaceae bacterium]|nr:acylneuraminate cytidylyltransferase family protein [Anaerovoracaceae bacterium]
MNILITICGRAGSKGLRNKNIREFLGKPLIHYTIVAAYLFRGRRSGDLVDICVNSDSDELLSIAGKYDVIGIERPEELAQDASPKVPAIRYSLEYMEERLSRQYDFVIDLDITSPLRKTTDIENALAKALENGNADVVFSVVPSRRNPYFNMVEKKDGKTQKIIDLYFPSRQQAPEVYDMNASVYCYRRNSLLDKLKRSPLEGVFDIILMKDTAVLDIDSEEDFELMELLAGQFFKDEFQELFDVY